MLIFKSITLSLLHMTKITVAEIIGVLLFACGGALTLHSIYQLRASILDEVGIGVSGFLSFLVIGVGLWLIVSSNKCPTIKN